MFTGQAGAGMDTAFNRRTPRVPGDGPTRRLAVTLGEVLVVIGIVVLMLAMLIPSLSAARERSHRLRCSNNLRQWGIALQCYRNDHRDYIPTEGTYLRLEKPHTWFNVLPPYLGAPPYKDVERTEKLIEEFPAMHVWICPSKNRSPQYKSETGWNQFHYGMNMVLDGRNDAPGGNDDTCDFPDEGDLPIRAHRFSREPNTVFMFDIFHNLPHGFQRDVATKFHNDYANVLYLDGRVDNFQAKDFVTDGKWSSGDVIWDNPRLYWGYRPPPPEP